MGSLRTATVVPYLRDAWAQWISQGLPWQAFLTMTSDHRTHPEAVLKRFRYCTHIANDSIYGRRWERRGQGVQWVAGIERHKSWNPHLHAVLTFPDFDVAGEQGRTFFPLAQWQETFTRTGGICRLELARSSDDVGGYVTKYVVKDGELHWSPLLSFTAESWAQSHLQLTPQPARGRRGGSRRHPVDG